MVTIPPIKMVIFLVDGGFMALLTTLSYKYIKLSTYKQDGPELDDLSGLFTSTLW
jgi:hypothetical protein